MKPVFLLSTLLLFSLRAQAPVPVPLAHGNVPGEPHHHLKIENTYVRAYYVEIPPHGETELHQHDHDYIFVTLGASDLTNAVLGKSEVHLQLKDGEVRFTRGGFAHVARNNSDASFRNVTIEFLHPQGEVRNRCEKVVDAPLDSCWMRDFDHGSRMMRAFNAENLNVFSISLKRKGSFPFHHTSDALVVAMDQSILEVSSRKLSVKLESGEMAWVPGKRATTYFRNRGDREARFLLLFFEDSHTQSVPRPGYVVPR